VIGHVWVFISVRGSVLGTLGVCLVSNGGRKGCFRLSYPLGTLGRASSTEPRAHPLTEMNMATTTPTGPLSAELIESHWCVVA